MLHERAKDQGAGERARPSAGALGKLRGFCCCAGAAARVLLLCSLGGAAKQLSRILKRRGQHEADRGQPAAGHPGGCGVQRQVPADHRQGAPGCVCLLPAVPWNSRTSSNQQPIDGGRTSAASSKCSAEKPLAGSKSSRARVRARASVRQHLEQRATAAAHSSGASSRAATSQSPISSTQNAAQQEGDSRVQPSLPRQRMPASSSRRLRSQVPRSHKPASPATHQQQHTGQQEGVCSQARRE